VKALLLIVITASALAVGVYAYFKSLSPLEGPRASITSPPVELSIELDKTEYSVGENLTLTFCLTNIGNETIRLKWGYQSPISSSDPYVPTSTEDYGVITSDERARFIVSNTFHFAFTFAYDNGTVLLQHLKGVLPAIYYFDLEPNGYVKQTLVFIHDYGDQPFFPEGTFTIRGMLYHVGVADQSVTLETPSISFTVR
jgi:hypothetical protein